MAKLFYRNCAADPDSRSHRTVACPRPASLLRTFPFLKVSCGRADPPGAPSPFRPFADTPTHPSLRLAPSGNLFWPAIPHSNIGALISRTVLGHNLVIMLKP